MILMTSQELSLRNRSMRSTSKNWSHSNSLSSMVKLNILKPKILLRGLKNSLAQNWSFLLWKILESLKRRKMKFSIMMMTLMSLPPWNRHIKPNWFTDFINLKSITMDIKETKTAHLQTLTLTVTEELVWMVKSSMRHNNTHHHGVEIQHMMLTIDSMEAQNHPKEEPDIITPHISTMKMPKKNGGDISWRTRIIWVEMVWFPSLLESQTTNLTEPDLTVKLWKKLLNNKLLGITEPKLPLKILQLVEKSKTRSLALSKLLKHLLQLHQPQRLLLKLQHKVREMRPLLKPQHQKMPLCLQSLQALCHHHLSPNNLHPLVLLQLFLLSFRGLHLNKKKKNQMKKKMMEELKILHQQHLRQNKMWIKFKI